MKAHITRTIQKSGNYQALVDQAYREGYVFSGIGTDNTIVMVFETERTSAKLKEPAPQTSA